MFEYPAIFSRQRQSPDAPLFACFSAPVGEVRTWAAIDRLSTTGNGHQRIKNPSRVKAIVRYFELNESNTIPTSLTVALRLPDFPAPTLNTCASLTIPDGPPAGIVIDGQHRLFGMSEFDESLRVNVVALINPPDDETAFQFLVINQKVTKVPTDHLTLLSLNYSAKALGELLRSARMVLKRHASLVGVVDSSPDSPFVKSVKWPTEDNDEADRTPLVLPAAIEQALAAIAQKNLPDLRDDDPLLEFFFTLWSTIKETWPELWHSTSALLSKVGVVTLTAFVIDDLVPLADRDMVNLADPPDAKKAISDILKNLDPDFWRTEWTSKSLDTSAGRQLVVDALVQVRRNIRRGDSWKTDVSLVAKGETSD
jgi:DGQHR domain-containing protein